MVTKNNTQLKTIKISPELHKELLDRGAKGETFEYIIWRLIATARLSDVRRDKEKLKKIEKEAERLNWEGKL